MGSEGKGFKSNDRGAWARVELAKHRPLRGRCFTELAPGTGARVNYRGDLVVREVGPGSDLRRGLDPMA